MQSPTTLVDSDASDHANPDPTTLSLPLHVPMPIQTYYQTICKNQPLARRNVIIQNLQLASGPDSHEKYKFVIARVKHLGGHDISDRLDCLIFETSLYSPIGSSARAKHIVSQCRQACFSISGDRFQTRDPQQIVFDSSPDSNVKNLCSLDELFRLVTIISQNSHLYSTDIDASFWFAATIMETARAIFPQPLQEWNPGWFKRTFHKFELHKPKSEGGRLIVAAYKADKRKHPIPTHQPEAPSQSTSKQSNAASENETPVEA